MKIKYQNWRPTSDVLAVVATANDIIEEYARANYTLTLRQLYYQFVARDIIENSDKSYKRLGSYLTRARLAGLVSWEAIEDRNREHHYYGYEESEEYALGTTPYLINFDHWGRQDTYVEVWVEKEALGNVVSRACGKYKVPHMSCKGYLSASEAWRAGQRYEEQLEAGKNCVLIHLGDHDPSGVDMTRDNDDRLALFTGGLDNVDVQRIALNRDQIDKYGPPPNPAKVTDSRAKEYIRNYGVVSWELDALEPAVLEKLITDRVESFIDFDIWEETAQEQRQTRRVLTNLADRWEEHRHLFE